jgi:hypothetical protein
MYMRIHFARIQEMACNFTCIKLVKFIYNEGHNIINTTMYKCYIENNRGTQTCLAFISVPLPSYIAIIEHVYTAYTYSGLVELEYFWANFFWLSYHIILNRSLYVRRIDPFAFSNEVVSV